MRLRGQPGEPQFHRDYADKLALLQRAGETPTVSRHSFASLARDYQCSPEFKQTLADRTQSDYSGLLGYAIDKIGDLDWRGLKTKHMVVLRNSKASTPRRADYLMSVMSAVFTWKSKQGEEDDFVNPCHGVDKLHKKVKGYEPWTEDQLSHFLQNCGEEFYLPVMLGLHTGQRLSDCVNMGRKRWTGRTLSVLTSKTGEYVECHIGDELLEALQNRPNQDQPTLVTGKSGKPYKTSTSFGNRLREEVARLGLPALTFHGLRYAACARLEDAGMTPWEIKDIVGHRTFEMAKQYAEKRRLREKVQRLSEKSATPEIAAA